MSASLYNTMKRVIERDIRRGTLDVADTKEKLETFYAVGSLTRDEYLELLAMVEPESAAKAEEGMKGVH